jgi:hypothetical protein
VGVELEVGEADRDDLARVVEPLPVTTRAGIPKPPSRCQASRKSSSVFPSRSRRVGTEMIMRPTLTGPEAQRSTILNGTSASTP